jgi:hypothetical protein
MGLSSRTTSPRSVIHDVETSRADHVAGEHVHAQRSVGHRGGVEHGELTVGAGHEALGGEPAREVQGKRGRLGQLPHVGTAPRGRGDGQRQAPAVHAPGHLDRARPGIEAERERAQHERAVHARDRAQAHRRRGAEQGHLQPAVLLQLEAVVGGHHLAHAEADLLAAVVDALPRGRGPVA